MFHSIFLCPFLDKSSAKYFCKMELRNYHSKLIIKIEFDNGEQITDQSQIIQETKNFYKKKLYSTSLTLTDENIMEKLSNFNFNKLTDEEAEQLEGEIKYSEVLTS